mmetsp:Transcript_15481/g.16750  ORF Transcript_15481/g.16750 Transcript_15481/m.16750 type:complete len:339 (+) Transcript_15481:66-1082(+)
MPIATSQIVYVVAESGTGKTFVGDYLEQYHDFQHIDGDLPLRTCDKPEIEKIDRKFCTAMTKYPDFWNPKNIDLYEETKEYWVPYYDHLAENALEAAKTHDKVVITFATGANIMRTHFIDKLKEGGAENITMLVLTMDERKKLESLYHRTIRQYQAEEYSLGDGMRMRGWDGEGEPTMEEYVVYLKEPGRLGDQIFEQPSKNLMKYTKFADVTGRDVTAIDAVDTSLGLQRASEDELSFEDIKTKVIARDKRRDEETPYNFTHLFTELQEEMAAALAGVTTEEEKKEIKKRASSIINMEVAARRFSILSIASDTKDETQIKIRKRRSSFIKTGKINME